MFGCDGISDHGSWNEVFHYRDTKLSCTKSRSQSRTLFCTAAQNYETVLISISPKDVGLLWYHQMLERIMGNYQLKLYPTFFLGAAA